MVFCGSLIKGLSRHHQAPNHYAPDTVHEAHWIMWSAWRLKVTRLRNNTKWPACGNHNEHVNIAGFLFKVARHRREGIDVTNMLLHPIINANFQFRFLIRWLFFFFFAKDESIRIKDVCMMHPLTHYLVFQFCLNFSKGFVFSALLPVKLSPETTILYLALMTGAFHDKVAGGLQSLWSLYSCLPTAISL